MEDVPTLFSLSANVRTPAKNKHTPDVCLDPASHAVHPVATPVSNRSVVIRTLALMAPGIDGTQIDPRPVLNHDPTHSLARVIMAHHSSRVSLSHRPYVCAWCLI